MTLDFFQETLYSLQCADNYNDVIMSAMAFQITGVSIVSQSFVHVQIKEEIKAAISLTKGQ